MTEPDHLQRLQVLSFELDNDHFAIEIGIIQEVIEYRKVTRVPRCPDFMQGVINLRGQVIPVVDLRVYFGMHAKAPNLDTCIIIIDIQVGDEACAIGIIADSVQEVVEFDVSDIRPAPKIGLSVDNRFIYGMVEQDQNIMVLLSVQKVFNDDEIHELIDSSATQDMQESE